MPVFLSIIIIFRLQLRKTRKYRKKSIFKKKACFLIKFLYKNNFSKNPQKT